MLFFNANFICYYFYPTKKREEPKFISIFDKRLWCSLVDFITVNEKDDI